MMSARFLRDWIALCGGSIEISYSRLLIFDAFSRLRWTPQGFVVLFTPEQVKLPSNFLMLRVSMGSHCGTDMSVDGVDWVDWDISLMYLKTRLVRVM